MEADDVGSSSLNDSDITDMMMVAEESVDTSKKRKLGAEESYLLPLPKHLCRGQQQASLTQSSCPSSYIESAECSYTMETNDEPSSSASVTGSLCTTKDSTYTTTGSSSSGCSKGKQYVDDDLYLMEFICPDEDVPRPSCVLSSASWHVSNQDSEDVTTKPTIDQEFEDYFSDLMM